MLAIFDRAGIIELRAANVTMIIDKKSPHLWLRRDNKLLLESGPGICTLCVDEKICHLTALQRWWQVANSIFLVWETDADFSVTLSMEFEPRHCTLHWYEAPPDARIEMKFRLDNAGHWYGQGILRNQQWPLERMSIPIAPFMPRHQNGIGDAHDNFGGVQTPLWVTSRGVGILVSPESELEVGFNAPITESIDAETATPKGDNLLRIRTTSTAGLRFTIRADRNITQSCLEMIAQMEHPYTTPPQFLFERPVWSTRGHYKTRVNQNRIIHFAEEITLRGFPHALLEIDDRWERFGGDLAFDLNRFPTPRALIEDLHGLGFGVVLQVTPFVTTKSRAFPWGRERGYFVRRADGTPYLINGQRARAALLDVSHPEALQWFLTRLRALEGEYGIDGFNFCGGEATLLPPDAVTARRITGNDYTHSYVNFAARCFPLSKVNVGWFSQQNPIFFRQGDKLTTWDVDGGLGSLIPQTLTLAITGYPFTVPGIIGGKSRPGKMKAGKELYIRWTQACALLPAVCFSRGPWEYDRETEEICRHHVNLRQQQFAPYLKEVVENVVLAGEPIVRPLFWEYPEDERSHTVDDQFLLGERYLVAPMLTPSTRRDIYLPPGDWIDWHTQVHHTGPVTLKDQPVPLDCLPIFERGAV